MGSLRSQFQRLRNEQNHHQRAVQCSCNVGCETNSEMAERKVPKPALVWYWLLTWRQYIDQRTYAEIPLKERLLRERLQYLGEEGENCQLKAAVACSNPWNLEVSSMVLQKSWIGLNVYQRVMGSNMKKLFEKYPPPSPR